VAFEVALDRLQRWMQAVVVHPGSVAQAVAAADARVEIPPDRVGDVVLPTESLSSVERVGIYHGMYLLRMEEALATDYPGLKHFLGDDGFFQLVKAYVQVHPSRSYTFNRLGDRLPDFVAGAEWLARRGFSHDLARLELAVSQVFDANETPALTAEQVAAVPAEAWERARLRPIAAFRLLSLRYPVSAYLDSLQGDTHQHPRPVRKDVWVAIYRRQYTVYRHDLSRSAHDLLADLVNGRRLGQAVAAALKRRTRPRPDQDTLHRWFRQWVAGGIFAAVDLAE
jgi:hypothetical protein